MLSRKANNRARKLRRAIPLVIVYSATQTTFSIIAIRKQSRLGSFRKTLIRSARLYRMEGS
jgi:hypothetical protein